MLEKQCPDCRRLLPMDSFHSNARRPDGVAFYCKECALARMERSRRSRGIQPARRIARPVVPAGMRWCGDRAEVKPLKEFPRNRNSTDGRHGYCKPCHGIRCQASRAKVGGSRHYHLRRRYGIGSAEVTALIEAQGGVCAICGRADPEQVDHDHATGKVRGILCFNCNGGLGQFRDEPHVLGRAIDYLRDAAWQKRLISPGVYALQPPRLVTKSRAS